jgi:hypothetical protein
MIILTITSESVHSKKDAIENLDLLKGSLVVIEFEPNVSTDGLNALL